MVPLKRKHQRNFDFRNIDKAIIESLSIILKKGFTLNNVNLKDSNVLICIKSKVLFNSFQEITKNTKKFKVFLYILQRVYNVPLNLCHYYEINARNYEEICWGDKENKGKVSIYCFPMDGGGCEIIKNKKLHHRSKYILN